MGEDPRRTPVAQGVPGPDRSGLAPTLDSSAPDGEGDAAPVAIRVAGRGIPHRIGRFQILRQIGAGGMGVVYAAYDQKLDRRLALKLVRSDAAASESQRARIVREAQAMARISHPNVVPVYEVGEVEGHVFIAMELVEGTTLSVWQRGQPWERILRTYLAAAEGLHAAHSAGLVHRDFKPDNVLIGEDGRVRVLDFGLARAVDAPPLSLPSFIELTGSVTSGERLTQAGTILGTPGYMPPEQVRGAEADARSDQFSFCAALYEALYQRLPFAGETFDEFALEVLAGRLRPPPTHEHPLVLEQALVRGLSMDPGARFPSMQGLIAALRAGLDPDSESLATRRASRRFGVLVVLSSVVAASQMLRHGWRDADKDLSTALLVASIFLLGVLGGLLSLRRSLLRRERYRRLAFFALVVAVFIMAGRTVGYLLGHTANRYMPIEMMAMAALLVLEAPKTSRRYGWLAALMAAGGIAVSIWPQLRSPITNLIYPFTAIAAVHYALRPGQGRSAETPPERR